MSLRHHLRHLLHPLLLLWCLSSFFVVGTIGTPCNGDHSQPADKLDILLANAMFDPSSSSCAGTSSGGGGFTTSYSTSFVSSADISVWDEVNAPYEEDAFGITMSHAEDDNNENRSWSMRIGEGSQIMSLIGVFGEAVSNQAADYAPWNDLVIQPVSVDSELHETIQDGTYYAYFIHGSGPYMRQCVGIPANVQVTLENGTTYVPPDNRSCTFEEGMPPPFYNPTVAQDCSDGDTCATINWGTQAHLKTIFRSDLLYYTKYRDCGQGVIEYDIIIHNYSEQDVTPLDFLNTPWTGIRTSTFQDMMVASSATPPVLEHDFPLRPFGPQLRDLKDTGGFTTFTQDLQLVDDTFEMPCTDPGANTVTSCDTAGSVSFQLQVTEDGTAQYSGFHSDLLNGYAVQMGLCDQEAIIPFSTFTPDGLVFTNDRSGFTVDVPTVIHWCWNGNRTFFLSSVEEDDLNAEFVQGDTITVTYNAAGLPNEDNVALTFVHGRGTENEVGGNTWMNSRMRYGLTNQRRDGTVWTTNFLGEVESQQTYYTRKFMIIDRLAEMEGRSQAFVDDAYEDVLDVAELAPGEDIRLFHSDTQFGAALDGEFCPTLQQACVGSSTPKANSKPLFYITCGEGNTYVGSDTYALARDHDDDFYMPYLCEGQGDDMRPCYKLLGFFPEGDCAALESLVYEADLVTDGCPATATPSAEPTTDSPSASPTTSSPVRAPTTASDPSPGGTCFSGDSTVHVLNTGPAPLREVRLNDWVLARPNRYEPIYSFGHYDPNTTTTFLRFLPSGLEITENHLVLVRGAHGGRFIPASRVVIGDILDHGGGGGGRVDEIRSIQKRGLYAPFTPSGTVVVNGVLASSYALLLPDHPTAVLPHFHELAHLMQTPHRFVKQLLRRPTWTHAVMPVMPREEEEEQRYTAEGLSLWVDFLFRGLKWVRRQHVVIRLVLAGFVFPSLIMLHLLELVVMSGTATGPPTTMTMTTPTAMSMSSFFVLVGSMTLLMSLIMVTMSLIAHRHRLQFSADWNDHLKSTIRNKNKNTKKEEDEAALSAPK